MRVPGHTRLENGAEGPRPWTPAALTPRAEWQAIENFVVKQYLQVLGDRGIKFLRRGTRLRSVFTATGGK